MNWEIFSLTGYISIALWLCMPLLWLLHRLLWRRGWLVHVAVLFGVAALVLAKVNSNTYVNRIQVDRSEEIEAQLGRRQLAQQAATAAREDEVAQIRFAEDSEGEFLNIAGMDEADRKYLESFNEDAVPEWKKEKKERTAGIADDSLESQIGATEEQEGVASAESFEDESIDPILMSDKDKLAADRLDAANLRMIRIMLALGVAVVAVDYLRRANRYDRAYFPLPLPSRWVDAMTPREPIAVRSSSPRRSLLDELRVFTRRGESFVYVTDDHEAAAKATTATFHRLPLHLRPVEVLNVANYNGKMDDDFVFETLWYGRNSFVVNSADRGRRMFARFIELLSDRRDTRAHVNHTVHVVWDTNAPISEETCRRFASLGRATGYSLLLCRDEAPTQTATSADNLAESQI